MRTATVLLALLTFALASPTAPAAWFGKGQWEPDTSFDATQGWMFTEPTVDGARRVYFSGFNGEYVASFNPNVATAQSSFFHGAQYAFYSMLGVWTDCNNDGYVGLGDEALFEYRAEALGATYGPSICPAQATPSVPPLNRPPPNWYPSHNDGQWVREWLPISHWAYYFAHDPNPYDINDNDSRVWADFGLPASPDTPALNCPAPDEAPAGTYHSTGGLLQYADCWDGYQVTDSYNTLVASVNGDNLGLGQLSFKDHPREQSKSASRLNARNPWGTPQDGSYARVWNCGSWIVQEDVHTEPIDYPDGVPVENPPEGETYAWVNVSMPGPGSPNAGGSPAGTLNETGQGLDECDRQHGNAGSTAGNTPYALEDPNSVIQVHKNSTSAAMYPLFGERPAAPWALVLGKGAPPGPSDKNPYNDFGTHVIAEDAAWTESNNATTREDASVLSSRLDLSTRTYFTYYAYISPAAISSYQLVLPKGSATGTYGFEACGTSIGPGAPPQNGWDCDPTHWWRDSAGNDIEPLSFRLSPGGTHIGQRPGAPYHMRDIDCYDQNVGPTRDADVDPSILTGTPCSRP